MFIGHWEILYRELDKIRALEQIAAISTANANNETLNSLKIRAGIRSLVAEDEDLSLLEDHGRALTGNKRVRWYITNWERLREAGLWNPPKEV